MQKTILALLLVTIVACGPDTETTTTATDSAGQPTPNAAGCIMIDVVPFAITAPGRYCLGRSFPYEGAESAITINADNVTIDGQGFCLTGSLSPEATSNAIRSIDRSGIVIRDLCVRGFRTGISIEQQSDTYAGSPESYGRTSMGAVRDIRIENATIERPSLMGIVVSASTNVVVRDSSVTHVGGSVVAANSPATAIRVHANNCTVAGNRIMGLNPVGKGDGVGISIHHGRGCTVSDNVVSGLHIPQVGKSFGIRTIVGHRGMPLITGNTVIDVDYAFGPHGIYVNNTAVDAACASFAPSDGSTGTFLSDRGTSVVTSPAKRPCGAGKS